MQINGTVAMVTGASSGIGAATAVALAEKGATVVAVARRVQRLEEVIDRCRRSAPRSLALPADVGDPEACRAVVAAAVAAAGAIDILVNNAGISPGEDARHRLVEDVERVMAVNFMGPVHLTGAVLPGMLQRRRGSVVNVTSVSGHLPNPGEAAYGASKAALSRWSHGLNLELHGSGVHVGELSPGPIATEIWEGDTAGYSGKLYPPEVVAAGVVRMVERELVYLTVPRRFGAVGAAYPLVGRPLRWGLRKYGAAQSD